MKKISLLITLFVVTVSVMAQQVKTISGRKLPIDWKNSQIRHFDRNSSLNKAAEASDWYEPSAFVASMSTFTDYVDFMLNDTCKFITSDGTVDYRGNVVIGQVIDPKDDNIDLMTDNPVTKFSKFTNYRCDSINMVYLYVRRVDKINNNPVVDTLFVYYFKGNTISKKGYTTQSNPGVTYKYADFGYTYSDRSAANYSFIDTILLSDKSRATTHSSTGWGLKSLTLPVNHDLSVSSSSGGNANNLLAVGFKFKPGMAYDTTYTLEDLRDSAQIPSNTKWVNYFGFQFSSNQGPEVVNSSYYNTSLYQPSDAAFKPAGTIFDNMLFPGTVYTNDRYNSIAFHLASANSGVNELENINSLNAFPNPANGKTTISFNVRSNEQLNIALYNLVGQKVMDITNGKFSAGNHEVEANLSNLKAGVYVYSISNGTNTQSRKLVISE